MLLDVEKRRNFAWKEWPVIGGVEREVVAHRKGATPAGAGVLVIIPGSMATPGYVASGEGNAASMPSGHASLVRLFAVFVINCARYDELC